MLIFRLALRLINSVISSCGETIAIFLAQLKHLTENCEFGTALDEMLRDRLVYGFHDIRIQRTYFIH